jgi:hypothetical protein
MAAEVFRFVTVRPAELVDGAASADSTILLERRDSALADSLRKLRRAGNVPGMTKTAKGYVASDDFIRTRRTIPSPWGEFADALGRLPATGFFEGARGTFDRLFDASAESVVTGEEYARLFARAADSLVVAAIDDAVSPKTRSLLVRLVRALWIVRRIASGSAVARAGFLGAPIVMPDEIFPIPAAPSTVRAERKKGAEEQAAKLREGSQLAQRLSADLATHRRAIGELVGAVERHLADTPTRIGRTGRTAGFPLPAEALGTLSEGTRKALDAVGMRGERNDVTKAVALLDRRAEEIAGRINALGAIMRNTIHIGTQALSH